MPDRVDAKTRSRIMSRIQKKWSQIDRKTHGVLKSAKILHSMYPKLPGSPDVLIHPDILVFLDGCFWHCCPRCFRPPKSRVAYWRPKLAGNRLRDIRLSRALTKRGWRVVRIWEHEIKAKPSVVLDSLRKLGFHMPARRHPVARPSLTVAPVSTRRRSR